MQQFLLIIFAMPLVASGSGMFSLDDLLQAHAAALVHSDGSLKADSDAAHERVKLQLDELEKSHGEHLAAHEDAKAMLDKFESQHGLADLKYFHEQDRLALQATNDADREEVKQKLAKLAAMQASNESSADTKSLQEAHEKELARLEARHEVFASFDAQAQAAAAKEHGYACAKKHLAKIHEMHKKAAAAPKSVRGTTARHILHKDPAFLQAMTEEIITDTNSAVNLAQTRAVVFPGRKRVHGGGDWNFAFLAAVGAFSVSYLTVSQVPGGLPKDSRTA